MKRNTILESCKFVADHSKYVKINFQKIDSFCESFHPGHIQHWYNEAPFDITKLSQRDKLHFLLVCDSISFSYWGAPKWKIQFHGEELDGAYGMIGAMGSAIENNFPILDPKYLSTISEIDFSKILTGNIQIPLFQERLNIIREVGNVLLTKCNGDFAGLIQKADGDSQKLLQLIVENFPSFRDESIYQGKKVYFYKRTQLLVADIYQAFAEESFGKLKNIPELTACADYKLPYVLRRLGIFSYSEDLAYKIDNKIQIEKDSEEEVEIRANTIWAVELIKQKIQKKTANIDAIHINDRLWMLGQEKLPTDKPYHLTRTTAY